MAYPYITQQQLEDRCSADAVRRILDDNNDGEADTNPIERILKDASAKVAGYLRGIYNLDEVAEVLPEEVVRLTLDVAEAYLWRRFPEYSKVDWIEVLKLAESELKAIRKGETRLDVEGSPEPAANQGGEVEAGNPDNPTTCEPIFQFGLGDF